MRKRKKIISDIDDIAKLLCTRRNFDKKEFRKIIYSEKIRLGFPFKKLWQEIEKSSVLFPIKEVEDLSSLLEEMKKNVNRREFYTKNLLILRRESLIENI